jgi:hypothetical protein
MTTAQHIEQALGLTRVVLYIDSDGRASITANEPVTDSMQRQVQAWHDAGGVPDMSALATAADIKAEAGRRILDLAPSWRQANMIARTLELTNAHGADPAAWPAEVQAERAAFAVVWDKIKAIRAHSDALELAPPTLADLAGAGWPE